MFHGRLMGHLGVEREEAIEVWNYEGVLQAWRSVVADGDDSGLDDTATRVLRGPRNTLEADDGQKSAEATKDDLIGRFLLSELPLLPDDIGDPEVGSGGPPAALKALWGLIRGGPTDKADVDGSPLALGPGGTDDFNGKTQQDRELTYLLKLSNSNEDLPFLFLNP